MKLLANTAVHMTFPAAFHDVFFCSHVRFHSLYTGKALLTEERADLLDVHRECRCRVARVCGFHARFCFRRLPKQLDFVFLQCNNMF